MKKTRRRFTASFKTKVVLEAIKERSTLQEIASKFELHPNQITTWKKEFLDNAEKAFSEDKSTSKSEAELETEQLYSQIGKLKMENEWLKKKVL